jgi:hypothetical protein
VVLENADRGFLDFQRQVSHRSVVWSLMKRNSHVCRRIGMVCKTVAVIAPYPRTGGHHVFQRRQNGTALRSGNPRRGSRPSDPGKTRLQWCLATSSIRSPIKSPRPWARQRLAGAIEVHLASTPAPQHGQEIPQGSTSRAELGALILPTRLQNDYIADLRDGFPLT